VGGTSWRKGSISVQQDWGKTYVWRVTGTKAEALRRAPGSQGTQREHAEKGGAASPRMANRTGKKLDGAYIDKSLLKRGVRYLQD